MKNAFSQAVDEIIALKMEAINQFVEEVIDPLMQVGNPEKLIGKKYENWTPLDLQLLSKVYGNDNNSPLAKLIAGKEYERVLKLEAEV